VQSALLSIILLVDVTSLDGDESWCGRPRSTTSRLKGLSISVSEQKILEMSSKKTTMTKATVNPRTKTLLSAIGYCKKQLERQVSVAGLDDRSLLRRLLRYDNQLCTVHTGCSLV
jgi:hypothetical protein